MRLPGPQQKPVLLVDAAGGRRLALSRVHSARCSLLCSSHINSISLFSSPITFFFPFLYRGAFVLGIRDYGMVVCKCHLGRAANIRREVRACACVRVFFWGGGAFYLEHTFTRGSVGRRVQGRKFFFFPFHTPLFSPSFVGFISFFFSLHNAWVDRTVSFWGLFLCTNPAFIMSRASSNTLSNLTVFFIFIKKKTTNRLVPSHPPSRVYVQFARG